MEKFFHLKENGTTVSTEIMAGLTTFFAMSYIIIVNPQILSSTGMPWGGVFLATIIAAIIGTLVMGLFANVPYAQAAGMGLNAFFTYTVCFGLGFKWQETLCMVFLCGLINIIITVTKIRKMIIQAIPEVLQNAIGGGIGLFVAYVGFLNVGFFTFTTKSAAKSGDTVQATPGLAVMNNPTIWLFIIGLVLAIVLTVLKVRGGMLIAIAVTAVVGIPMGQTTMANSVSIADTFAQLPQTFGVIFTKDGFPALFSDVSKLPIILLTIFAFSMSDTFDTIGTFIGTGRRTGIFSAEDEKALENGSGFSSKMDKALFADSIATSIGAIWRPHRPDLRGRGDLLRAVRLPLPGHLRRAVRRDRRRAGRGRLHDGFLLEGNRVGRHLRSHSGVLRVRVHGVQLLHLLRHRRRLHHLLHRQDLQEAGQGRASGDLGRGRAVHSGLHHHRSAVIVLFIRKMGGSFSGIAHFLYRLSYRFDADPHQMAWENASTSAAIQSVRESYCSGICSVSSTIGILDDLAAVTILPVNSVSS